LNVLFLTLSNVEDINQRGIYTDFIRAMSNKGINMYIVSPSQKRESLPEGLTEMGNIRLLKVKTGNITKTKSLIEKGLSTIQLESQYLKAIKKYFKKIHFDMVVYSTPPITFNKILKYFKRKHHSKTYLILKDIFPQNAVDIGLLRENSIIWKYFRKKEIKLYNNSDLIGCMSQGNVDYILEHNQFIQPSKVEVFPNAIDPIAKIVKNVKNTQLLEKYNVPKDSTLFVYGGNIGKPQGIDYILNVVENFNQVDNSHLLIVGNGTEFNKIQELVEHKKPKHVTVLDKLPKAEYDQLIELADVGIIFLDNRFTIPNFPSRLTSYMENALPILAATDKNTDIKDVIIESGCGCWSESQDVSTFIEQANYLANNSYERVAMGQKGREYLENNYDINKTVNIIIKHIEGENIDV
jgi:glycosyltransferase involved in cell wall biosynthesis